jgi:SanA protein
VITRFFRIIFRLLWAFCGAIILFIFGVNVWMKVQAFPKTFTDPALVPVQQAGLVLGTRVYGNEVSDLLQERLDTALEVYRLKRVQKLLVSGDHGSKYYDEVDTMRKYLEKNGVPPEDIFMDHAGFSTYDSLFRARNVFRAESLVIVTQDFHLPRSLYIAHALGVDAVGLRAGTGELPKDVALRNAIREPAARMKAWWDVFSGTAPMVLGPQIPLSGDGRQTLH